MKLGHRTERQDKNPPKTHSTTPFPEKFGHFLKAIKYLSDRSTKKIFPMFSLTNIIVYCKYKQILMYKYSL